MTLYKTSITYTYRNGSQFTEHYAKPLNVDQLANACVKASNLKEKESNIVKAELHTEVVDTSN